ncbi:MAG: hypothetical protein GY703_19440 [Gammaproteobacteria bacterium]|nr:hypothetical protein [Gammaproteobacteria bacterium]
MPYFVYRISEDNKLQCLDQHNSYKEARGQVRKRRSEQAADDTSLVRLIFASSEMEAERLLLTPRESPVEGDD